MKNFPYKNGVLYRSMKKHRFKFLLWCVLLAAVLCTYTFANRAYLANVIGGSVPLDSDKFQAEITTEPIGAPFKLHRGDPTAINGYALKKTSYWQGVDYEFDLTPQNVADTGVTYTMNTTGESNNKDRKEIVSAKIYTADIEGIPTVIIAYPHQKPQSGKLLTGIFAEFPKILRHDLAEKLSNPESTAFCSYVLDIRGVEMESENFDISFCAILAALLLWLSVKLILQFTNPYRTPTYRQLEKYGDTDTVIADIESQLQSDTVQTEKKKKITEDWILQEDTFKLKVTKNHLKNGNMEYTPHFK